MPDETYPLPQGSTTPVGGGCGQTFTGISSVSPACTWNIFVNNIPCAYCVQDWQVKFQKDAYCYRGEVVFVGGDFLPACTALYRSGILGLKITINDGSSLAIYEFLIEAPSYSDVLIKRIENFSV